jgi:hypothetical protein
VRSLSDVTSMYEQPFDQAVCWRGGSEAQAKRHIRRGETPCRACQDAANRASEDRTRRGSR